MIVDRTGPIAEDVHMLGHWAVPIYLVDGDHPALFDAGLSILGPEYARQVQRVLDSRQPEWCFLTHSHFDHCGSVAYLKRRFPKMKVVCSPGAAEVLTRPSALQRIADLNRFAAGMADDFGVVAGDAPFEPFAVDAAAKEGDRFEISSGTTVRIMETPGHTWDFVSYYIPERRLLVASEALGTPDETGYIVTDCLVDYDVHYRSMERLNALDVEILCLGHICACTGEDARRHMSGSLMQSRDFRRMVERYLDEARGDAGAVAKRVKAYEWDGKSGIRQPEPAYLLNLEARIKTIMKKWAQTRADADAAPAPGPCGDSP
ncbi:MAG TPA: MBL fold metallo-hydrolase [Desulfosarcina sp.]|nr:MBL fold metallo-hydrolase [Desulfosarcina sp.]